MFRDIRKNKIFGRRLLFLGAAQAFLTSSLVLRLSYLQIWKHKEYSIQSDSNRIKSLINPSPRGVVFDRDGIPLAVNDGHFRLLLYLDRKKNAKQLIEQLSEVLKLSEEQKISFHEKIKNSKRKRIVSLIDRLEWNDLARIESYYHLLPGISIESGIIRRYPYPEETAHFLGYVSLPSEKEIDKSDSLLFMHPDFRIGKFGIEKSFDETLRGKYGVKYVEVDVHEVPLRTLSVKSSHNGLNLNLTIDLSMQKFITNRIKNDVASVVLMDVKSGEVLSYASSPSFNPNNFVEGISKEYWKSLSQDPRRPLGNKPISALYPPGSTFKLMVALAALEQGFNPATRIHCNGYYQFGRRAFHCWKEGGHGSLDLVGAIMNSCNTYFFTVANSIGHEPFTKMARRFGYGQKVDISLYGSKDGLIPDDEWKRKVFKQPWAGSDTLNTAIGQGSVLATPIQMALVTARIANGGVPIKPYLVRNQEIYTQYNKLRSELLVNPDHLNLVQEGMRKVINEPGGTAYGKRIEVPGYEMAGKTGTSQVISKRESEMTETESRENANHAIFVGYAPVGNPKYAVSVVVEHGKSGSMTAAPIGKDIMMEVQGLNNSSTLK